MPGATSGLRPSPFETAAHLQNISAAIVSFTDNTTGTASDTLIDLAGVFDDAELEDAVASLAAKIEEILVVLRTHDIIAT